SANRRRDGKLSSMARRASLSTADELCDLELCGLRLRESAGLSDEPLHGATGAHTELSASGATDLCCSGARGGAFESRCNAKRQAAWGHTSERDGHVEY